MSDFSPLNIFKSQAKQLARDQGLKLSVAQETLVQKAGFADYHEFSVVAQRNLKDPRLMLAVFGIMAYGSFLTVTCDIHKRIQALIDSNFFYFF